MKVRTGVFLIACLMLVACSSAPAAPNTPTSPPPTATAIPSATPHPCALIAVSFLSEVDKLTTEWDDANKLANVTGRIALSGPVTQLQGIRRRLDDLKAPPCALDYRRELGNYMDNTITGYLAFMSQQPEAEVNTDFADAKTRLASATVLLLQVKGLATPVPTATPLPQQVTYWAVGSSFDVTYLDESGQPRQMHSEASPWQITVSIPRGQHVKITVKRTSGSADVKCDIWIDGGLWVRESSGSEVTCETNMSLP